MKTLNSILKGVLMGFPIAVMVLSALVFLFAAVTANVTQGFISLLCLGYGVLIHLRTLMFPFRGYEADVTAAVPAAERLIEQWWSLRNERRGLSEFRLTAAIEYARLCRDVQILEEELMLRFGGQRVPLPDGRTATIGTPGCKRADRIRIS